MGKILSLFIIVLSFLLMILASFGVYSLINQKEAERNFDCYINHIKECLECHNKNLTYALCSGFCFEPREEDLTEKSCIVMHPQEDCFDLPKHCNF